MSWIVGVSCGYYCANSSGHITLLPPLAALVPCSPPRNFSLLPSLGQHTHNCGRMKACRNAFRMCTANCRLDIPIGGNPPPSTLVDNDHASAQATFVAEFEFAYSSVPLNFVAPAISGAMGVHVDSIGLVTKTAAEDELGRQITAKRRRLLHPFEWTRILRASNLQLSVALAVGPRASNATLSTSKGAEP